MPGLYRVISISFLFIYLFNSTIHIAVIRLESKNVKWTGGWLGQDYNITSQHYKLYKRIKQKYGRYGYIHREP